MSDEITLFRGDSATLQCAVKDNAGAAFDISPYFTTFTVREYEDDTAIMLQKDLLSGIVYTNPTGGIMEITIDPGDTDLMAGEYLYDIELDDSSGSPPSLYTVVKSTFTINKDVTH